VVQVSFGYGCSPAARLQRRQHKVAPCPFPHPPHTDRHSIHPGPERHYSLRTPPTPPLSRAMKEMAHPRQIPEAGNFGAEDWSEEMRRVSRPPGHQGL
jgi:hypothetical protein